jgi:lipopolysaccharide biosynthesis glycosyltransferase
MSIPKLFFQTSKDPLEPYIVKMTKAMLPNDWTYRHFLDQDIVHFLKSHPLKEFPGAVEVFQKLKQGEHKADFFRYYFLFCKGGVFMDSDAMIYKPIDQIIKGYKFFSVKSEIVPDCIFQGILGAEPRNPLIGKALEFFFKGNLSILEFDYHFLCRDIYRLYQENQEKEGYHLFEESPDEGGDKILDGQEVSFRHFWRNKEEIPRTPGILNSKNLVYCCVFYNKDYFKLLDLLLKSLRMYSSEGNFDFLVITQNQFEPLVKEIGRNLGLDLKIFCLDFSTIFQAACARLFIFDYPEIQGYEKLLYIDTDILIKAPLDPVFQILDGAKDVLYGIESGTIESLNFGAQFFNFNQIDKNLTGINSGTLLFLNSIQMKSLFQRIRGHLELFTQSGNKPPYCMDQPFINFHAIKDKLYDNKALNPYVSLFENNDTVDNYTTSSICHFSFPIGNFGHKYNRMCDFLAKTLNKHTNSNTVYELIGQKYSWNQGYIKFMVNYKGHYKLETTWGEGSFVVLNPYTLRVFWNNFYHVLKFNKQFTEYISIRTSPKDFEFSRGYLIESYLNIYGDSHAALSLKNLQMDHRNLFQFSRTMFRIGRDNQIINFKPDHASKDRIFCLAYGEVDVRGHIGRQVGYGRHHETVCKELVNAYFKTIELNITQYKAIIIIAISPPTAMKDHEPCNIHTEAAGGPIPFVGTDRDRIIYRKRINELLEEGCSKFGYIFFNPYGPYTREDGTLKYELSDKCIHIGENTFILNEFKKLITSLA